MTALRWDDCKTFEPGFHLICEMQTPAGLIPYIAGLAPLDSATW
jgi:hypothetical protein